MRITQVVRGGGNWSLIPPERMPSPNFWNKVVKGTPYEYTQVQLANKGLHDPWIRNNVFGYDNVNRRPMYLVRIIKKI
jgi:hypothetical protein